MTASAAASSALSACDRYTKRPLAAIFTTIDIISFGLHIFIFIKRFILHKLDCWFPSSKDFNLVTKLLSALSMVCLVIGIILLCVFLSLECQLDLYGVFLAGSILSGVGVVTALSCIYILASKRAIIRTTETRDEGGERGKEHELEPLIALCEEEVHIFVETSRYKLLEHAVITQRKKGITVIGYMGDGTSASARHVAWKLRDEGYELIEASTMQEIEQRCTKHGTNTVILVDDPFGTWCVLTNMVEQWVINLEKLQTLFSTQVLVLIITTRKHVWDECKHEFKQVPPFDYVVDFTSCPLSKEERTQILEKHMQSVTCKMKEEMIYRISKEAPSVGYPQCCKLFAAHKNFRAADTEFFNNQLKYIRDDLTRLIQKAPHVFGILAVIMLHSGRVLHTELLNPGRILNDILDAVGKIIGPIDISDKFFDHLKKLHENSSLKLYLTSSSDSITFSHDSLYEAVALEVGEADKGLLFDYCNTEFLSRVLVVDSCMDIAQAEHGNALIGIQEEHYTKLCTVLTNEILKQHTRIVFQNPSWTEPVFCQKWGELVNSGNFTNQILMLRDDVWQHSVLHWAAYSSLFHVVEFLVNKIPEKDKPNKLFDLKNNHGATVLHSAATGGNVGILNLLIDVGFRPNVTDDTQKALTPLYIAAASGKPEAVKCLLDRGATANIETSYKLSPLLIATICKQQEVVRIIQSHLKSYEPWEDLETKFQTIVGMGEIHVLARDGNIEGVQTIVKLRKNVDEQNSLGWTPLHIAIDLGNDELVSLLLRLGANANITTAYGLTPLYLAAVYGHRNIYLMLKHHGAKDI